MKKTDLLAKELVKIRRSQGYYQSDVAEFLGIERCSYTSYETGRRMPDLITLLQICQFFTIPYTRLMDVLDTGLGFYTANNNPNIEFNHSSE